MYNQQINNVSQYMFCIVCIADLKILSTYMYIIYNYQNALCCVLFSNNSIKGIVQIEMGLILWNAMSDVTNAKILK